MFHGQILCKEVSWDLDADGESLDVENTKGIIGELVNQEIAKADLDAQQNILGWFRSKLLACQELAKS